MTKFKLDKLIRGWVGIKLWNKGGKKFKNLLSGRATLIRDSRVWIALDIYERTNPVPYFVPHFGCKVHVDQNEKIAQGFGCTHAELIEG